jgi:hypothetical protein
MRGPIIPASAVFALASAVVAMVEIAQSTNDIEVKLIVVGAAAANSM